MHETKLAKIDLPPIVPLAKLADGQWVVAPSDMPLPPSDTDDSLTLTIDDELRAIMPPLAKVEFNRLFDAISAAGRCNACLIVWRDKERWVLLDGHYRLAICLALLARKRRIPFMIEFRELPDREAARRALIDIQFARRNLSDVAVSYFRGKEYLAELEKLRRQEDGRAS